MIPTLVETIRNAVIGDKILFDTSFGKKPLVYADYTASGRSLSFIEDYIQQQVLPYYANTHTETSYSGAQTTALREQARNIIHQAVNGQEGDQVIFCGPGATSAINKLIDILNIRLPADLEERYQLLERIPAEQRPVVFIGPYEHHSNELPWRESIADLEVIPLGSNGQIDECVLEQRLKLYENRVLKIGSFSAASNVTGIKTDVNQISSLLHHYGAESFWDYAAAAPYVGINMNVQSESGNCSKDAVFISMHKFIGGPGTPGVLVVKKHLLSNSVPAIPGGGTVMYVTPEDHIFVDDHERREEGGTPAIVESIRAGLAFKLQQDVGTELIESLEDDFVSRAISRWQSWDNIDVLGGADAARLSIVSLRIKHNGKDLHYGFVVALLNDLFGIQARGGCSCAGPYGHALLNMDMDYSRAIEAELAKGHTVLRPGWVRLNFNYFIDEDTFEYLVKAIEMIAEHGWRLLPFYHCDIASGAWRYQMERVKLVNNLNSLDFQTLGGQSRPELGKLSLSDYLDMALVELFKERTETTYNPALPANADALRWFVFPQEVSSVVVN